MVLQRTASRLAVPGPQIPRAASGVLRTLFPRSGPGPSPAGDRRPEPGARSRRGRVWGIEWYHTIDLGNGIVTPGAFDHRPYLHYFGLPERFDGKRVLDVATFDGFWAFEFEKRGAAEVVAIDLDHYSDVDLPSRTRKRLKAEQLTRPLGTGFSLAHQALGSKVRRVPLSVYD